MSKKELLANPPPDSNRENEFMDVQKVASHLHIKRSTVYQWTSSKSLPCYKFGRLIRIRKRDLEEWIEKHRIKEDDQEKKGSKEILRPIQRPNLDIDQIIKEHIAGEKGKGYTVSLEKPGKDKGLGKEESYGLI